MSTTMCFFSAVLATWTCFTNPGPQAGPAPLLPPPGQQQILPLGSPYIPLLAAPEQSGGGQPLQLPHSDLHPLTCLSSSC